MYLRSGEENLYVHIGLWSVKTFLQQKSKPTKQIGILLHDYNGQQKFGETWQLGYKYCVVLFCLVHYAWCERNLWNLQGHFFDSFFCVKQDRLGERGTTCTLLVSKILFQASWKHFTFPPPPQTMLIFFLILGLHRPQSLHNIESGISEN